VQVAQAEAEGAAGQGQEAARGEQEGVRGRAKQGQAEGRVQALEKWERQLELGREQGPRLPGKGEAPL
jgi:hypothetical protein